MSEEKKAALTECASALSELERRGSAESITAVRFFVEGIAAGMELAKTSEKFSEIPETPKEFGNSKGVSKSAERISAERDFKDAEDQTESA